MAIQIRGQAKLPKKKEKTLINISQQRLVDIRKIKKKSQKNKNKTNFNNKQIVNTKPEKQIKIKNENLKEL